MLVLWVLSVASGKVLSDVANIAFICLNKINRIRDKKIFFKKRVISSLPLHEDQMRQCLWRHLALRAGEKSWYGTKRNANSADVTHPWHWGAEWAGRRCRSPVPGLESKLCHLLALWPWANYCTSVSLSFLICKIGILISTLLPSDLNLVWNKP